MMIFVDTANKQKKWTSVQTNEERRLQNTRSSLVLLYLLYKYFINSTFVIFIALWYTVYQYPCQSYKQQLISLSIKGIFKTLSNIC